MMYLPREHERPLRRLLRTFPAVLVLGPRQSGKSTLVRKTLPTWKIFDLERPADLALVSADIEGFLDAHSARVVIDEAQRLPELFPALRHAIDRRKGKGRFVLLGSASPALMRTASESLAGRVGLLELSPLSSRELAGSRHQHDRWFWGGFPPVLDARGSRDRAAWLDAYVSTFLERDLPVLGVRLPVHRLRQLWTMLTHVHGNLLNVSDLARSLSVSVHTVSTDLDVLEAAFMIRRLQPFHANIQKRLTKSPKIYVRDTGLLHFLAGLRRTEELQTWSRRGSSFEGLVIEELCARARLELTRPGLHFWRTQAGAEVDLLIADGQRMLPIEVKLGSTVDARTVAGLRQCMQDLDLKRGWVVYGGDSERALGTQIRLVPWRSIVEGKARLFGAAR